VQGFGCSYFVLNVSFETPPEETPACIQAGYSTFLASTVSSFLSPVVAEANPEGITGGFVSSLYT
jgi:hypothetical protein